MRQLKPILRKKESKTFLPNVPGKLCAEVPPGGICHGNTSVGGKRTAPHDQVRKEACGLGYRGVIGQRNKIMVSLVVSVHIP